MSRRRWCYLRPNLRCETVHAAIWLDTETQSESLPDGSTRHTLDFGLACYSRRLRSGKWSAGEWCRFSDRATFYVWMESVCRVKTRTYLFCHNTAFDLPVLGFFTELPERGWQLKRAIIEAPPTVCVWRKGTMTLQALDTLNIWRMPLDKLGESIDLPKLPMPAEGAPPEEWQRYCRRDVEIIRRACLDWWDFLQVNDYGGFAPTLAAQAHRTFRHRFLTERILIDDDADACALARDAYVGGRVECFRLGRYEGEFVQVDANSLYPYCMAEHRYPLRLAGIEEHCDVDMLAEMLTQFCLCARVRLRTDEPVYPFMHKHHLMFPIGEFIATLSTPELRYALEHDHLIEVKTVVGYEWGQPFSEYVAELYAARLECQAQGDTVRAGQYKLLLNALYGKFGQHGRRYEEVDVCEPVQCRSWAEYDAETHTWTDMREFGGLVQECIEEGESTYSHPAIAAHVCAYGRMHMWRLMQLAGREHCYYMDTDSLILDAGQLPAIESELHPTRLGSLKVLDRSESLTVHGLKDYEFAGHRKVKGVSRNATWVSDRVVMQDKFSGFRGLLSAGSLDAPLTRRQRKVLCRKYYKGVVETDGSVSPWNL